MIYKTTAGLFIRANSAMQAKTIARHTQYLIGKSEFAPTDLIGKTIKIVGNKPIPNHIGINDNGIDYANITTEGIVDTKGAIAAYKIQSAKICEQRKATMRPANFVTVDAE